ncbi:MAG: DNA/RNA non-specific endonuclease, partial [Nitrososphaeraceae archaeon]
KTVIGINSEQATRIAQYDNSVLNTLSDEKRFRAERIQGNTVDFFNISFLESARIAGDSVGRVIFPDGQPQGSGFMVSDHLFLTNNHVVSNLEEANNFLIEFDYELDINDKPRASTRFTIDADNFFITSPEDELDFTLIAIGERISGHRSLTDLGYCPLIGTSDKHILGEFVNIIQHPEGDFKKIVVRENRLITRLDRFLHYVTDTMPGSSGSPVFNDQLEAIALHHYGEPSIIKTPDGKKLRRDINEGIRISAILNFLRSEKNKLKESQLTLLEDLLNPLFRQPSKLTKDMFQKNDTFNNESKINNALTPSVDSDGVAKWTIPLEISVRLGGRGRDIEKSITPSSTLDKKRDDDDQILSEAIRIDPNYENRSGYKSNFLSGYTIPLPLLIAASQKENAAKKLQNNNNEDPYELKYQHFSLVMNKDRRMAFFTAVNIDGSTWIRVDRDTGEPVEREAREKWFIDPRIEGTAQCEQSLYDNQRPI